MHKIIVIASTVLLVTLTGVASSADQDRSKTKEQKAEKSVGNSSQQEAEYLQAVKKCEGMEPKEKVNCIEIAKERFGEMLR